MQHYYIILENETTRNRLIKKFRELGIQTIFHYIPLHSSPAGIKYGRILEPRLTRAQVHALPLWVGMPEPSIIVKILTKLIRDAKA